MTTNINEIRIPLRGVESEHCALIVANGLAKLRGVETHQVELNNKQAVILTNNQEIISEAVKIIRAWAMMLPR